MLGKKPFDPSLLRIDVPDIGQINPDRMNELMADGAKEFKKSAAYKKYVQPVEEREKRRRRKKRRDFWVNNWLQILGLVFAFIAALPVIIQGIQVLCGWLKSVS